MLLFLFPQQQDFSFIPQSRVFKTRIQSGRLYPFSCRSYELNVHGREFAAIFHCNVLSVSHRGLCSLSPKLTASLAFCSPVVRLKGGYRALQVTLYSSSVPSSLDLITDSRCWKWFNVWRDSGAEDAVNIRVCVCVLENLSVSGIAHLSCKDQYFGLISNFFIFLDSFDVLQNYYQNRPAMPTTAPRVQTSNGPRPVGPAHVYPPSSQMMMISQQQLSFAGSPQGYFLPTGQVGPHDWSLISVLDKNPLKWLGFFDIGSVMI